MPPSQYWHCTLVIFIMLTATMCSTFFIMSMTFERFYSIIRPHKAASFNTVKRAKITIACIIVLCLLYNSPHAFVSIDHGRRCVPYGKPVPFVQVYYWFSFSLNFIIPFISLLSMNTVIIHTLRKRSQSTLTKSDTQGHAQNRHTTKIKNSESQIYIMLLVVTFGFLILITPGYLMVLYVLVVDYTKTPQLYAGYYFFYHFGSKLYYTNNGINFYLYVISGQKFRSDLVNLFRCKKNHVNETFLSG